ncbi:MAG: beta-lactamase family protein [Firmicutes bacterium]|nr:beta-lactamase family protein [Bacillota bacterium]
MLLVVCSVAAGASPQTAPVPVQPAAAAAPALTAADVEAFFDGMIPLQLEQREIAGVVVVVVYRGQVLFAKGYGYADVARKIPVSPQTTLFRPGSISKLFTWTAVMQLVEQGRIDLDRDVNEYLDFAIPSTFPQPITLRHILTHTPGFEDVLKNLFATDPAKLLSLREYLVGQLPQRIYPPGVTIAYSNYATALAGYIVERVSGQPFAAYVAEHIFQPLGMEYSTFEQPLPPTLAQHMSQGYTVSSRPARPFELIPAAPAGALSASGLDLARFMLAHLQQGQYGQTRILRPETARLMHARQWGPLDGINGMALGFYEESRNGLRIIGHGGDTVFFHSDLHLIPDAGLGFFFSQNSAGSGTGNLRTAVWRGFLDRYFPYRPAEAAPSPQAVEDVRAVAGFYISSRRNHTSFLRALAMLSGTRITARGPDAIEVSGLEALTGRTQRWQWIAPMRFRQADGQDVIAFRRDAQGRLEAFVSVVPIFVFQRVPWYQGGLLLQILLGFAVGVFALTLLLWPLAAWLRRHYGRRLELSPQERRVRLLTRLTGGLVLLFVLGFVVLFEAAESDLGIFNADLDPWLRALQLLGWLSAFGLLAIFYDSYLGGTDRARGWVGRLSAIVLALAAIAWGWVLLATNLLSLNLHY